MANPFRVVNMVKQRCSTFYVKCFCSETQRTFLAYTYKMYMYVCYCDVVEKHILSVTQVISHVRYRKIFHWNITVIHCPLYNNFKELCVTTWLLDAILFGRSHGLLGIIKSACNECRMFGPSDNISGKNLYTTLEHGKINNKPCLP